MFSKYCFINLSFWMEGKVILQKEYKKKSQLFPFENSFP